MAKIQTFFLLLTGGILNFISSVQRTIKTTLLRAMDNLIDNLSPETRIRGLSADVIRNNDTFEEKFAQLPMDLWMTIAGIPTLIIFWLAYLFPEIYNSFCKFLRSWVERIALTALIVIVALFSGYRSFRFVKERKRNSSYQNSGNFLFIERQMYEGNDQNFGSQVKIPMCMFLKFQKQVCIITFKYCSFFSHYYSVPLCPLCISSLFFSMQSVPRP